MTETAKDAKEPTKEPAKVAAKPFVVKTDGPDVRTAAPVEGRAVVQTSMGPLDKDTVVNNRVGGVGYVSLQHDPEETPGGAQPIAPAVPSGASHGRTTDTATTKDIGNDKK